MASSRPGSVCFNESILGGTRLRARRLYQALAVTAITGLAGNFAAGAWADRGSLRGVLIVALLILTGALVGLPHVTSTAHVMAQAVAMGVAGGFVMVVFFSFWGRAYGRTHLGRIQGAAQALTVFASATGPLLFAWCAADRVVCASVLQPGRDAGGAGGRRGHRTGARRRRSR